MCNVNYQIKILYKKIAKYKDSNSKRRLKRYHYKEEKISDQRDIYHEKNKDKILHQENDRYKSFKDLVRSYG